MPVTIHCKTRGVANHLQIENNGSCAIFMLQYSLLAIDKDMDYRVALNNL